MVNNIRWWILGLTGVVAGGVYLTAAGNVVKLTQTYAFLTVTYLWVALMATPVTRFFPQLPGKGKYIFARRAIGVSAWCFGLLHAYFAFFGELGGFGLMRFWNGRTWTAIAASTTALMILTAMAATSTDWAIQSLGFARWKRLHRLVYLVGILVVFHALTLGSHFAKLSGTIPVIFLGAAGVLGVMEAARLGKYLADNIPGWPKGLTTMGMWLVMTGVAVTNWGLWGGGTYAAGLAWLAIHAYKKTA